MRWSYIVPRLVIVLTFWVLLTFALDPLLRRAAVSTAQSAIGARAEIRTLSTQFFPPEVELQNVALADAGRPGTNLVEFESLKVSLAGGPLLRRQFVIREGRLTGVRFGTPRADDGRLPPEPPDDGEPSWLSDQLSQLSADWIERLTVQAEAMLDPHQLSTYRTAESLHDKWTTRIEDFRQKAQKLRPRCEEIRLQLNDARTGPPLNRVQQYLLIMQDADALSREALALKSDLTASVPEVRFDLSKLNQARLDDQQMFLQTAELFRPDLRRVSEAVLGEAMYRQLQEALTWMQAAGEYREQIAEQTRPKRRSGQDFTFPLANPSPDFHIHRLLLSGTLELRGQPTPFEAMLSDATEDPALLGRPCVLRLKTSDDTPLFLLASYDATGPVPVVTAAARYSDPDGRRLTAGRPETTSLQIHLDSLNWDVRLALRADELSGHVSLQAPVRSITAHSDRLPPRLTAALQDSLDELHAANADLTISGTVRKPVLELSSPIGEQLADGVRTVLRSHLEQTRQQLARQADAFADEQIVRLRTHISGEYDAMLADHADTMRDIQNVQTLVASLQSGQLDPESLFRTAAESKLLDDRSQQKLDGTLDDVNQKLKRAGLPGGIAFPGQRLPR